MKRKAEMLEELSGGERRGKNNNTKNNTQNNTQNNNNTPEWFSGRSGVFFALVVRII